jgi:hypothetical protein
MFEMDVSPQSPTRILLRGIKLGAASFRRLITLTTVLGFISILPTVYLSMKLGDARFSPDSILQLFKQGHFVTSLLLLQLCVFILGLVVDVLIILRIDQKVRDTIEANELFFVLQKLWPLILAGLLCVITLFIGMIIAALASTIAGILVGALLGHMAAVVATEACIFAILIYIAIYLMFFQFAIILDAKGPVGALNYSAALVFHNWWRTFLVLLYITLIVIVVLIMIALPLALFLPIAQWLPMTAAVDSGRSLLVRGVINFIITALFAPFIAGTLYVLYQDLKTRHATKTTASGVVQA